MEQLYYTKDSLPLEEPECTMCNKRVPIAIRTEPHVWKTWYVSEELAARLAALVNSDDFVTEIK